MTADQILMNALSSTTLLDTAENDDEAVAIADMIAEIIDCTVHSFNADDADPDELTEKTVRRIRLILPEHGYEEAVAERIAEETRQAITRIIADNEETENGNVLLWQDEPATEFIGESSVRADETDGESFGSSTKKDGTDDDDLTEFEINYREMVDKLTRKYPDAGFYGLIISKHSCVNDDVYSEEEAMEIIREFIVEAAESFDRTNYETQVHSVRKCFDLILRKHDYPAAKLIDGEQEIVTDLCLAKIECCENEFEEETDKGLYDPKEIIPAGRNDMSTLDMAFVFATVPYDVSDADLLRSLGVNYDYEHNHMCTRFARQATLGKGPYSRLAPNLSARSTYNHLTNPRSFLWIATVMGIHENLIIKAYKEMQAGKTASGMCGIIRKIIPFDMILCQAQERMDEMAEEINN